MSTTTFAERSDAQITEALSKVSTATLTTVLLKKGLRNVWIRGSHPLFPGQKRVAGRAFTLRFVPAREDLASPASWASPNSTRGAVEAMPEGCIAVVDAMGERSAGIFGDILCARMQARRVRGLVTDGVIRDIQGVRATGLPVWCDGTAAPPAVGALTFVGWQQPIACGGVAVIPGDFIVLDDDGGVVVPQDLVLQAIDESIEQERLEAWIMSEVGKGEGLLGLYPPDEAARARYEAHSASKEGR